MSVIEKNKTTESRRT